MSLQPRSASKGVRDQLEELIPRLRRFCLALTGNRDAGDDLMQAVLERALLKQDQFKQGTRLDHWLYRIARNLRIDIARAEQTRGGPGESLDTALNVVGTDGEHVLEIRSELSLAGQAFACLPQEQREVFLLVVMEGMTYRETANLLEIPIGTVMSRIARSRSAIEKFVNKEAGANG